MAIVFKATSQISSYPHWQCCQKVFFNPSDRFVFPRLQMMLNIFCCAYLTSLLFGDVFSCYLPIFSLYCLFIIEFWELSLNFTYQIFVTYVVCKHFLPVCSLTFSLHMMFRKQGFHFDEAQFINFFPFMDCEFKVNSKNPLPNNPKILSYVFSKSFVVLHFHFKSMIHFELNFVWDQKFRLRFFYLFSLFFFSLLIDVQLLWHYLLLGYLSSTEMILHFVQKSIGIVLKIL